MRQFENYHRLSDYNEAKNISTNIAKMLIICNKGKSDLLRGLPDRTVVAGNYGRFVVVEEAFFDI